MISSSDEKELTKEALKDGMAIGLVELRCVDTTLRAPGGKAVATWEANRMMTKAQSDGVAFNTVNRRSKNGFVLIENKSSINETFIADCLRSLQRC